MAWNEIPSHTQNVERHIKFMTETSTKVCGKENREGMIRVTLASRIKIPCFENKKQLLI